MGSGMIWSQIWTVLWRVHESSMPEHRTATKGAANLPIFLGDLLRIVQSQLPPSSWKDPAPAWITLDHIRMRQLLINMSKKDYSDKNLKAFWCAFSATARGLQSEKSLGTPWWWSWLGFGWTASAFVPSGTPQTTSIDQCKTIIQNESLMLLPALATSCRVLSMVTLGRDQTAMCDAPAQWFHEFDDQFGQYTLRSMLNYKSM